MAIFDELIQHASFHIYEEGITDETFMYTTNRNLSFYVMSYIQYGEALLRIDGTEYHLTPHSVMLIPPHMVHDHIKTGKGSTLFMWWHFDYMILDTVDMLRLMRLPIVFQLRESAAFEEAFSRYIRLIGQPVSIKNALLKKAYMAEIMALLLEVAEESPGLYLENAVPELFMEIFGAVISSNTQVSLKQLAERFSMHPTYISNKFTQYFGIAPIQLARKMQVQQAIQLLCHQGKTVSETAAILGYKDLSTFTRFFISQTGMPPSKSLKSNPLWGMGKK